MANSALFSLCLDRCFKSLEVHFSVSRRNIKKIPTSRVFSDISPFGVEACEFNATRIR